MAVSQTWSQRERRYQLDEDTSIQLLSRLSARLPAICYRPGTPASNVVTTYLDTQDRYYLRLANDSAGKRSLKLRIREYRYTELGSDIADDTCFLERKLRINEDRLKQRIRIPKKDVGLLLERRLSLDNSSKEARAISAELEGRNLQPVLTTHYTRRVFGDEPQIRVTMDEGVTYYSPPAGLFTDAIFQGQETLGRPCGKGPTRILEIKHPVDCAIPQWLESLLVDLAEADSFSKFHDGMRAIAKSGAPSAENAAIKGVR